MIVATGDISNTVIELLSAPITDSIQIAAGSGADTYVGMMRANARAIVAGLGGEG